ncbi:MAG: hypothetical protein MUC39_04595 [Candidatus Omnitrophica bacterium]|jgi:hypothetical protein|nr:hypothetical protein [Candidatus Omnitrophota bacterium]
MEFIDLRKELKNVCFEELRQDRDDYLEAVVKKDELEKLTSIVEKFLGPAIPQSQLPKGIENTIGKFGGIMHGQSLYLKNLGHDEVMVMFWPWQDGEHTTVKINKK